MIDSLETLKFIDQTLDDMTTRPAFWGPLTSVEQQVLRLLEVRLLLVVSNADVADVPDVARAYWEWLDAEFPGTQPVSLRTRVKGDIDAFSARLKEFCLQQRRTQDARAAPRVPPLREQPRSPVPLLQQWTAAPQPQLSDRKVEHGESSLPR